MNIPFVNEFSESGKNRPEYFEFRLGGESQATGVYKDIREDCERRSQQRLNSKDEGYICIVIPNYNHNKINLLLHKLALYKLPCIIIDDGSDTTTKNELITATTQFSWVHLLTLANNQGKGAAILAGFEYAITQNYTHAIQIDADGQHDTTDITLFLAAIKKNPTALITGTPIYDQSAPKSRLYGRKITNFWVKLETFSATIKDAMCGYRAYPLKQTLQIMQQYKINQRMGFDIEIIVRFYWEWQNIISIPTKVIYPPDGISHFKLWRDNLAISWLHTRLFFGMLKKLFRKRRQQGIPFVNEFSESGKNRPEYFEFRLGGESQATGVYKDIHEDCERRSQQRLNSKDEGYIHWSKIKEKGTTLGMNIIFYSYQFLGQKLTSLFLYPIIIYFYCFSPMARKASKEYLLKIGHKASVFKHFLHFADSILDKIAVWHNDIPLEQVEFPNIALFRKQIAEKKGGIIFTAHLGNMEIARALSKIVPDLKINVALLTSNAKKISSLLEKNHPEFKLNLIPIDNPDLSLVVNLQQKITAGEFIAIACDRTSASAPQRYIETTFLGATAYFPEGPFILAGLLQCPAYFMLCLKKNNHLFEIVFQEFAANIDIKKTNRKLQLQHYAQKYSWLLEKYCHQYPLQWFNFFNFWKFYEKQK